jgi:hypothetical protein
MLPLPVGIPARRLPVVNVALIAANFAVWIGGFVFGFIVAPCLSARASSGPGLASRRWRAPCHDRTDVGPVDAAAPSRATAAEPTRVEVGAGNRAESVDQRRHRQARGDYERETS